MGKQGYNGRDSKSFQNGSNPHLGASRSQSGSQSYGGTPKPQRSGSKPRGGGMSIGDAIFGPRPVQWGYGSSKKGRKKK